MARNLILIAVIVLILGGLFFLLRPESLGTGPQDRTFDLSIEEGEMSPSEISVNQGDMVTLHITSDERMDFHVHGYNVEREVAPGQTARLHFEADLTGRFEIEDHETEEELGVLEVRPR